MDIQSPSMVTRSGRKRKIRSEAPDADESITEEKVSKRSRKVRSSASRDSLHPIPRDIDDASEDDDSVASGSVRSVAVASGNSIATPSAVSSLSYADLSAQRKMRRRSIPHTLSHRATPTPTPAAPPTPSPLPPASRSAAAPSPSTAPRRLSRRGKCEELLAIQPLPPPPPLSHGRKIAVAPPPPLATPALPQSLAHSKQGTNLVA